MPFSQLSLAVVGARYPNRRGPTRLFEIQICAPGERIDLVPEPKNPADPHAIAAFSLRGVQIGYLTAERAPWIGAMMAQGRPIEAIFQKPTQFGAVIRVAFDGEEPELPPETEAPRSASDQVVDDDPGFWPDFIPPDD